VGGGLCTVLVARQSEAQATDTQPETAAIKLETMDTQLETTDVTPNQGDGRTGSDQECCS
jgi:hypothetical protein